MILWYICINHLVGIRMCNWAETSLGHHIKRTSSIMYIIIIGAEDLSFFHFCLEEWQNIAIAINKYCPRHWEAQFKTLRKLKTFCNFSMY